MDRISAAGNLTIEVDANQWRLVVNGSDRVQVLLEAAAGQPLRYQEIFATKRRLPPIGVMETTNIQRVVLGWSRDDECWHLGLLLEAPVAQPRGSRWCEIARWPDPDTNVFDDLAAQAGRSLARTLGRPFNLIEPEPQATTPVAPPPPLRPLPLSFDLWTLDKDENLQITRAARWARSHWLRILWYALLVVIYVVLSITTLTGTIALPRPEFLPYLGIVTAVLLFGIMVYTWIQLMSRPDRFTFTYSGVQAMRGSRELWMLERSEIEAVYVSEVVNRKGKKRVILHGELNLLLKDSSFKQLVEQPHPVEDNGDTPLSTFESVSPLTLYDARSDMQMAGLHLAQTLNLECRYDLRLK